MPSGCSVASAGTSAWCPTSQMTRRRQNRSEKPCGRPPSQLRRILCAPLTPRTTSRVRARRCHPLHALVLGRALPVYRDDGRAEMATAPLSGHCGRSLWVARTTFSPTPTGGSALPVSTPWLDPLSSMASIRKRTCDASSSASPSTRLTVSMSCCLGMSSHTFLRFGS